MSENNTNVKVTSLICPYYFLLRTIFCTVFDFKPSKEFYYYYNLAIRNKEILFSIYNNTNNDNDDSKLENWELLYFKYIELYLNKDVNKVISFLKENKDIIKQDLTLISIVKAYLITTFGYNKKEIMHLLYDITYNQEYIDKIIIKQDSDLTKLDYLYCISFSFFALEVDKNEICEALCNKGLKYLDNNDINKNLYLIHNNIHIFQMKGKWNESIKYLEEETNSNILKNTSFNCRININDDFNSYLNNNNTAGVFIHQHVLWHLSIACLMIAQRNGEEITINNNNITNTNYFGLSARYFLMLKEIHYYASECYVNILGYFVWVQVMAKNNLDMKALINNLLSNNDIDKILEIVCETKHYLKHCLFDFFSIWFLSCLGKKDEIIKIRKYINETIASSKEDFISYCCFIENIYENMLSGMFFLGQGNFDVGRKMITKEKEMFCLLSGSEEQRMILNFIVDG